MNTKTKTKTKKSKSKNIRIEASFLNQLEILCGLENTNFSQKAKSLLTEWQIERLAYLKANSPEKFKDYLDNIQAKK